MDDRPSNSAVVENFETNSLIFSFFFFSGLTQMNLNACAVKKTAALATNGTS